MDEIDVTVIGGGLAGTAASIHLVRAGLRVVCVEGAAAQERSPVGESLDWSAPELLKELGLPMEELTQHGVATYKRHVVLKIEGGGEAHYVPGAWLGRAPYHVELRTLHVDRNEMNAAIRETAVREGVEFVREKVVDVERDATRRVFSVTTESGRRIAARWFLDASGSSAHLFPRLFQLPVHEYGPSKVAMWDYFRGSLPEGTTLYGMEADSYMEWVWQIPIRPNAVSVGYVARGETIKKERASGKETEAIFRERLERFPALRPLLDERHGERPQVTSFRCRVHQKLAGPNWIVIGEAASMIDPMTSNGVTAALRQAREAAQLIVKSRNRKRLPRMATTAYTWRVIGMARFFNCGIERVVYDWPIRRKIGALKAGDVYTIPAWLMNLFYTRLAPRGIISTGLFGCALAGLRCAATVFFWWCRRGASAAAGEVPA